MNTKMKLKNILTVPLTISLAVFISACNQPSNSVPIQSDSGHSDEYSDGYQNQYQNTPPNNGYSKPVVVVNKYYYYQTKPKVRVSRYKRK